MNSIRDRFDYLSEQIRVNILLVSETKIDDNFPQGQFVLDGFSVSSRLDCNCLGGDLMLFVREDVPSDLLKIEEKPVVNLYVELN